MENLKGISAAVYLRKSRSDSQNEDIGITLKRHKDALLEFAAKNSIIIVSIYEEVVSGDSLYARPQMLKLLSDSEDGEFSSVLCMDIDRLGRGEMSDQGIILETFKANDICIITPRKIYDLNNELDEEYTEFETFMARRELKTIKRRLSRGLKKTIDDGGYIANAPYGYKKIRIEKTPTLEIVEEEANFVRMIFDLYVNQGMGCQRISDTLESLGAKPHRSEKFSRGSIAKILRNNVYIGKITWDRYKQVKKSGEKSRVANPQDKWLVVDGIHPPIVDEETYEKANMILGGRYHPPSNTGEIVNPLAGLLKCETCGRAMVKVPFTRRRNTLHSLLLCSTKGCCCATRLDRVEDAIIQNIEMKLESLKAERKQSVETRAIDYGTMEEAAKKERKVYEKQVDNLHNLLEQGVYDIETYLERSRVLKEKISDSDDNINRIRTLKEECSEDRLDETIATYEDVLTRYENSEPPTRHKLLYLILAGGTYYKEKGWKPNEFYLNLEYK